jgi:phosphatidylglycerol:prolipoprotein diacylglycerol transferase
MMPSTLAAWLHDWGPFLIEFGNGLGIRWYGLSYMMGFAVGWWWLLKLSDMRMTPLSRTRLTDAMILLVLGVVGGGRLGYVVFYEPSLLWTFGDGAPWWGLLQLNKGGMSSHGGMIGVLIATWFIARGPKPEPNVARETVPWRHVMDLMAIVCTPGLFFGRLANFINGELLSKVVAMPGQPAPWWAVKFPQEVTSGHRADLDPDQRAALDHLVEAFRRLPEDSFELCYQRVLDTLHRGGVEGARVAEQLSPLLSARHPSQLYQALTDGLILAPVLWMIWKRPRRPGVIACWFLIVYGVMRVLTEFVRLPDSHLAVQRILGFSRGQWLSIAMVVLGALFLHVLSRRAEEPKFGGWSRALREAHAK